MSQEVAHQMESNWDEWADLPLYAAVKAADALTQLQLRHQDPRSESPDGDRTASILTFRVRFDASAAGQPSLDVEDGHAIQPQQQRMAN